MLTKLLTSGLAAVAVLPAMAASELSRRLMRRTNPDPLQPHAIF